MVPQAPFYRLEFRTLLIIAASVLFVALISSYILFQARFLVAGPQINLVNEPGVQHNVRSVTLSGAAHNITHLWLNDRQIFTDEAGNFEEALTLENGYTVATLKARDRFGRETRVERSFVYTPASLHAL
jgi:hypothetical protein